MEPNITNNSTGVLFEEETLEETSSLSELKKKVK